jgi:LacI family transcriptional regulator
MTSARSTSPGGPRTPGPNRRARPTITDVARAAGVAPSTVSHVLNASCEVSPVRRERVLAAVRELGYVPNIIAQTLRRRRSTIVGLCVPTASFGYFIELAEAFEALAARDGYDVMHVFSQQNGETELQRVETLLRFHIGGLLLLPSWRPQETLERLANAHVPTVLLDRPVDDQRFDQVVVDVRSAMRAAVAELAALGHRRFLFVTSNRNLLISKWRIEGLRQGIRDQDGRLALDILERPEDPLALRQALKAAMQAPDSPTAVLASNTLGISQVLDALRSLRLRLPEDVSVLALDEPVWAGAATPSLSVVRRPAREVAETAWGLLLARLRGEEAAPRRAVLQPALLLQGSVGPAPDAAPARAARRRAG